MPAAIPKVAPLHGPESGEAVFGVFFIGVLDGGSGFVDAVVGEGVAGVQAGAKRVEVKRFSLLTPKCES